MDTCPQPTHTHWVQDTHARTQPNVEHHQAAAESDTTCLHTLKRECVDMGFLMRPHFSLYFLLSFSV